LAFIASLFLCTCGLEDYPLISPVPQSNITQVMNNHATVRLPNNYAGTPFTNFAVFYRIYVSNVLQATTTSSSYSAINSALASDYNSFSTYIDSTTLVNTDMDALFQGRGYKYLNLQGNNISAVLSSSVLGTNLDFDFASSKAPTMTVGSTVYTLWRSDGNGLFTPRPDRLFMNKEELWRTENINDKTNADVVNKSDIQAGDKRYTYAAMFITAVGINTASYSNIYSTPSLIHVFQLPD
jgi:hypothetical protein